MLDRSHVGVFCYLQGLWSVEPARKEEGLVVVAKMMLPVGLMQSTQEGAT